MAKGRKKSRSLFELMDPRGVYRSPVVPVQPGSQLAESSKEQNTAAETEQREPSAVRSGQEEPLEAFVSVGEGKIRLAMNYPLAVLLCFAIVILLICAVLIGWRLGRDRGVRETQDKIALSSSTS